MVDVCVYTYIHNMVAVSSCNGSHYLQLFSVFHVNSSGTRAYSC